jgi:hypothetical protein
MCDVPSLSIESLESHHDKIAAGHILHANLIWPNPDQADQRRSYLVSIAADALDAGGGEPFQHLFVANGGLGQLSRSKSLSDLQEEHRKAYRGWVATYLVVRAYMMISELDAGTPRSPSLRRAADIAIADRVRWTSADPQVPVRNDANWIKKQFRAYRPVAHLCTAYVNLHQQYRSANSNGEVMFNHEVFGGMSRLLGHAATIEDWFMDHADSAHKPLLDRSTLVTTFAIPGIERLPIPLVKLTNQEFRAYRDYKAPLPPA